MNWNSRTIKTYNKSAEALAKYFKGIGPRVDDIELALELANATSSARVVEVGCGDGRDAVEIIKRVGWYEGFDPSEGLLQIARQKLPQAPFVRAAALTYKYPSNLDVMYAFASLLHINKADLKVVFEKAAKAIRQGGIFYISLKEGDTYTEKAKKDEYGERMFYYYNVALIKELAGNEFSAIHEAHQKMGKTDWFTIALRRN
ncbi:MAG TPA: class I SAM-dependent methyltransferase [Candidatus Saccharimonadales bacterium]|nr:class I SAM-dependent methyltransferase [Candidatus Saccharimonadales bacterium]